MTENTKLETREFGPEDHIDADHKFGRYQTVSQELRNCIEAGYRPASMREILSARVRQGPEGDLWKKSFVSSSAKYTVAGIAQSGLGGSQKSRSKRVIITHLPSYLCEPANIEDAIGLEDEIRRDEREAKVDIMAAIKKSEARKKQGIKLKHGLQNGAVCIPNDYQRYLRGLDSDGKNVFVLDAKELLRWRNHNYGISEIRFSGEIDGLSMLAKNHPLVIPFIGGEEETDAYLPVHRLGYDGLDCIGGQIGDSIGIRNIEDPVGTGRFLATDGYSCSAPPGYPSNALILNHHIEGGARVYGIKDKTLDERV